MTQRPGGAIRFRIAGAATMLVAAGWVWAAWWVWDVYIPRLELSAGLSYFMAGGMAGAESGSNGAQPINAGVAEVVRHAWFGLMCLVAAVMAVAAAAGLVAARWSRRAFLAAGLLVLLGTIGTMAGIVVLIYRAGFPATITPLGYVLTCAIHALPGLLLLAVIGRHGPLRKCDAPRNR